MQPIQKPLPDPEAFKDNKPTRKERLDDDGKEMKPPDQKAKYKAAQEQRQKEGNK